MGLKKLKARSKLSVREATLGSPEAPENSRKIELSRLGVTTSMAMTPTPATPSIRHRSRASQAVMQMRMPTMTPR